jgi:Cu+-exporting ATPase
LSIDAVVQFLLATPVQFWLGSGFYVASYKALRHCSATMDVLVALGTSAAYFYSVLGIALHLFVDRSFSSHLYFETSAVLICFIMLGRYLENVAKGKTSEAITKLLSLQAKTAVLLEVEVTNKKLYSVQYHYSYVWSTNNNFNICNNIIFNLLH